MNWNKDKSIVLSQVCVVGFGLLLLALDVGAYWFAKVQVQMRLWPWQYGVLLMAGIYVGSVFGWVCLWQLWRLLCTLKSGVVFVDQNVRRLRIISWCCVGAAAVSLLSALYYPAGFLVIAACAGFMALIVRIVKNAFQQAVAMKSELDLTI